MVDEHDRAVPIAIENTHHIRMRETPELLKPSFETQRTNPLSSMIGDLNTLTRNGRNSDETEVRLP